jgi:hypothetical protein
VDEQVAPIVAAPVIATVPCAQLAPAVRVALAVVKQQGLTSLHCLLEKHCHVSSSTLQSVPVHDADVPAP